MKNLKKEQGEPKVLKLVHSFFAVVMLGCLVCMPCVYAAQELHQDSIPISRGISQQGQAELIQNEVKVEDLDIEPINTQKVKEGLIPDPSKEGKKVIGLFLKTMVAVAFCTVILYLILLFVRKYYSSAFIDNESEDLDGYDLSTPNNKHDALKSFLNRTK